MCMVKGQQLKISSVKSLKELVKAWAHGSSYDCIEYLSLLPPFASVTLSLAIGGDK